MALLCSVGRPVTGVMIKIMQNMPFLQSRQQGFGLGLSVELLILLRVPARLCLEEFWEENNFVLSVGRQKTGFNSWMQSG